MPAGLAGGDSATNLGSATGGARRAGRRPRMTGDRRIWPKLTLPGQFLLAGAGVMVAAMLVVGSWVSSVVKATVIQNSAMSAAQFVENFVSPIGQELVQSDGLSDPAALALTEIFGRSSVHDRVVSYKIWLPEGRVVFASNLAIIGQSFAPGDKFRRALAGQVASSFELPHAEENQAEAELDMPLLEVYMPLRQMWTDEVIGVVEFYERADRLRGDLLRARLTGWAIVGATFLVSGALLFGIVQAGGRKIRDQSEMLRRQLDLTRRIGDLNGELKQRAVTAAARAAAKSERMLRQLGSDLHDGPAQYLSLAALRLDDAFAGEGGNGAIKDEIRQSLDQAMHEIRLLSRGLLLPDLDAQSLETLVSNAAANHRQRTGGEIAVTIEGDADPRVGYARKLCVYRFLQEALSNAARHAPAAGVQVRCAVGPDGIEVTVRDDGPGFDASQALRLRHEGGQGLIGLRDRVESIGGTLSVASAAGAGTMLKVTLPIEGEDIP